MLERVRNLSVLCATNRRMVLLTKSSCNGLSSESWRTADTTITADGNGVATLDLHHRPANIFDWNFMDHLTLQFREIERQQFRAIIVKSSLKSFTAGADVNEFYSRKRVIDYIKKFEDVILQFYAIPIPTIAAINGHSFAGGCVFANACDYRFIRRSALFGLNESRLGIPLPYFVYLLAVKNLGHRLGTHVCLEGKMLSAEQALSIKWVDGIADDETQLMALCDTKINDLIQIPVSSYGSIKTTSQLDFHEQNKKYGEAARIEFANLTCGDTANALLGDLLKNLSKKT